MKNEVIQECYNTADKIINMLNEMGYTTDKVPAYPNLLRDLISIELKRNVNQVTTMFYNSVVVNPVVAEEENVSVPLENTFETNEPDGCCGGESEDCGCK